jgi:hypothetical protein
MADLSTPGTPWTDREIDLIVADYFDMLKLEMLRQPYVKAHRNEALRQLIGRSRGSIEYKHQNISAVLDALGLPWIPGYKPMANFQQALTDAVDRYLSTSNDLSPITEPEDRTAIGDDAAIFFGTPPERKNVAPPTPPFLRSLIRKFDPAARDARNRRLGKMGEEKVLFAEQTRLKGEGRSDLARKVRWISQEEGDGAGYDILSFTTQGNERLLEVKTTTGGQLTPFYLTENERLLSNDRSDAFRLVRLYDFARTPKAFKLTPPLDEHVVLQPTNYRASFGR